MQIKCPWDFIVEEIEFEVSFDKEIDLSPISKLILCNNITNLALETNKLTLSLCRMKSSITPTKWIKHDEVIVKIKTKKYGDYYYPLITFVNNELSLVRGAYLGFDKYFADIIFRDGLFQLKSKYGDLLFEYSLKETIKEKTDYPFILYRDYVFSKYINIKEFVTPVVSNYEQIVLMECNVNFKDINLINNLFPENTVKEIGKATITKKKYTIEGVRCICKE